MTIATTTNKNQYDGNGSTTVFAYTFRALDDAHIRVIRTDADEIDHELVLDTDFTVSGIGDAGGGNVTYPISGDPLPSGESLTILREVPQVQELDLANQGAMVAENLEDEFDLLVSMVQDLQEQIDRCNPSAPTAPEGEEALTESDADLLYVHLLGSTLTGGGHISDPVNPSADNHLARKGFNDATYVPIAGGVTLTGDLTRSVDPSNGNYLCRRSYVDDFFDDTNGHTHSATGDNGPKIALSSINVATAGQGEMLTVCDAALMARQPWSVAYAASPSISGSYSTVVSTTAYVHRESISLMIDFSFAFDSGGVSTSGTSSVSVKLLEGSTSLVELTDVAYLSQAGATTVHVHIPACVKHLATMSSTGTKTINAQVKITAGSPTISQCVLFVQTWN